jgi:hypothetical protein
MSDWLTDWFKSYITMLTQLQSSSAMEIDHEWRVVKDLEGLHCLFLKTLPLFSRETEKNHVKL